MKIVVVGDEGVGKRSFINKILNIGHSKKKVFDTHWASVGITTVMCEKQIDKHRIKYQMWILNPKKVDEKNITSHSKSKLKSYGETYCYGALGAIVVFDITNKKSFSNVQRWIKLVWENNGIGVIPLIIVGKKIDLRENTDDFISSRQGKELVEMVSKQSMPKGIKVHYRETTINDKKREGEEILQELGQSYLEWIKLRKRKVRGSHKQIEAREQGSH